MQKGRGFCKVSKKRLEVLKEGIVGIGVCGLKVGRGFRIDLYLYL